MFYCTTMSDAAPGYWAGIDSEGFAGNGVFRSTFVGIIAGPKAGVLTNWLWSFLNAGIQARDISYMLFHLEGGCTYQLHFNRLCRAMISLTSFDCNVVFCSWSATTLQPSQLISGLGEEGA